MRRRQRGERTQILLNELDLIILRTIESSKKQLAILELQTALNMSHMSLKKHINRLVNLGILERNRLEGSARTILKLTDDGNTVLNLFNRLIGKAEKNNIGDLTKRKKE